MIQITIFKNNKNECMGFQTQGHAEYSEVGQDIVCAATSVLMINTMNAIELYTEDEFSVFTDEEEGLISWHLTDSPSKEAQLLLNTMILGLKGMVSEEIYAEYIELTFEEV
jgi:hypothetical protein